jgi:ribonuclease Z
MVYICQAPDVRGKFDVKKAQALGVPNGPSRGMLVKGMDIEVDDPKVEGGKRTIKPEDCLVGGGPGAVSSFQATSTDDQVLVVVNCSQRNLDRLLAADYLKRYQSEHTPEAAKVHAIVHQVPLSVWNDERYQAWIKAYGPDTYVSSITCFGSQLTLSTSSPILRIVLKKPSSGQQHGTLLNYPSLIPTSSRYHIRPLHLHPLLWQRIARL